MPTLSLIFFFYSSAYSVEMSPSVCWCVASVIYRVVFQYSVVCRVYVQRTVTVLIVCVCVYTQLQGGINWSTTQYSCNLYTTTSGKEWWGHFCI